MKILVTGVAGFIGTHVARALLARGDEVVGLDILNGYYDVSLKEDRLRFLLDDPVFRFERIDIVDRPALESFVQRAQPDRVVHLAAKAGVRYPPAAPCTGRVAANPTLRTTVSTIP